jgi:hypothetical protein
MRYALRNQDKIEKAYPGMISLLLESLTEHFSAGAEIVPIESGEEFPLLIISGSNASLREINLIAFYIIEIKYDVYRLAFKEFIG